MQSASKPGGTEDVETGTKLDVSEVLITSAEIQAKVRKLGGRITEDYAGEKLLLVGILNGSVVVLSDLMRHIESPCEIDFMDVSSYGTGTTSSGDVHVLKDLDGDVTGRHVLIVEDIVDTGLTLSHLLRLLRSRGANSLEICTLLSKPIRREVDVDIKYLGFEVPDEFVVGYGIDYAGSYRNLPEICVLKPEAFGTGRTDSNSGAKPPAIRRPDIGAHDDELRLAQHVEIEIPAYPWCNCGVKRRGRVATLIESGGGTGPTKPRQPAGRKPPDRCQLPRRILREMRRTADAEPLSSARTRTWTTNYRESERGLNP